tara:strand:+ start:983 stop:1426 length:444 start_codon:yes stop_codon:yes gene_type:complete
MILISHRGNLDGESNYENNPDFIEKVINLGYDVEIDLRLNNGELYLGHDNPEYLISDNWLLDKKDKLWVHCKDLNTIEKLSCNSIFQNVNYFFHEEDKMTITSKGFLWVYPGYQPLKNSIAVLPEKHNEDISSCIGVCSDYIKSYKK